VSRHGRPASPSDPPRAALWLHQRTLAAEEREPIIGDLLEEFSARAERDPRAARRWVWVQTCRSIVPNLRRRVSTHRPAAVPADGAPIMPGLGTDFRFSLRLMRRQPLPTLVALVSLGAGIGLNVLLLALADAALFRPLPLRDPTRLGLLLLQRESSVMHNFSYPDYAALRDNARTLDSLVAYSPVEATVGGRNGATSFEGEVVSGNFFAALGVPMRAGRGLGEVDDRPSAEPAAVISEALWRERFGAPPLDDVTIVLNGQPYSVVGVAASRFDGMQVGRGASFWVPLAQARAVVGDDLLARPTVSWLTVIARLHSAASAAPAQQELDSILRRVRERSGRPVEPVLVRSGARGDSMLSEALASPMELLMWAGLLVLLVACFNAANLQLARSEARRHELKVRAALGAGRFQLLRLMMIDALLTAFAAGALGIWLAVLLKDRAASLVALYGQPVSLAIPLDARVLAAALLLCLVAALTIALLSAWQLLRRESLASPLDGRSPTATRRLTHRLLVVVQIALSMALLTGASLLVRTLDRLRHTPLGFDTRGLAVLQVSPEMGRLSRDASSQYFDDVVRAVKAVPGVERVAIAHVMPFDFGGSRTSIEVAGYSPAADEDMELNFVRISPDYFATIGLPVRQGRAFDVSDRADQPQRIIVNETMARRFWPGVSPVGRFVRFGSRQPFDVEVVGVVPDVHYRMVREEATPSFYVPLAQWPSGAGVIHVRLATEASGRIDELRRVVAALNPAVPVMRAHTLTEQIERNISDERMAMAIGLTLAIVALLLATAGIYATMAFLVGRRTREIGVRIALGARTAEVRTLVLGDGLKLAAAGVLGGLALSAWVGYALRNQIYGLSTMDGPSLVAAGATLTLAALIASWIPARRAMRVDPVEALRES
jgi:predicted permease